MLFGKLPSCVKRWQKPTYGLTLCGSWVSETSSWKTFCHLSCWPLTHTISLLSAPRRGNRDTATLLVAGTMKFISRGWACVKKRDMHLSFASLGWQDMAPCIDLWMPSHAFSSSDRKTQQWRQQLCKKISCCIHQCLWVPELVWDVQTVEEGRQYIHIVICRDLIQTFRTANFLQVPYFSEVK